MIIPPLNTPMTAQRTVGTSAPTGLSGIVVLVIYECLSYLKEPPASLPATLTARPRPSRKSTSLRSMDKYVTKRGHLILPARAPDCCSSPRRPYPPVQLEPRCQN